MRLLLLTKNQHSNEHSTNLKKHVGMCLKVSEYNKQMAIVASFSTLGKSQHFQIEIGIKKTFLHFEICKLPTVNYLRGVVQMREKGFSQWCPIICEKVCFSCVRDKFPVICLSVANVQEKLCIGQVRLWVKVMGLFLQLVKVLNEYKCEHLLYRFYGFAFNVLNLILH